MIDWVMSLLLALIRHNRFLNVIQTKKNAFSTHPNLPMKRGRKKLLCFPPYRYHKYGTSKRNTVGQRWKKVTSP
uniref:Uncharacterized protein n=1 Tax=Magnetococcus massalia (strain MO-1) TaxID=451514 RepID=A0A1S7LNP7_MAGMO|nr:protein of unknown function [Candidatus Magnetococcus massalia]